MLGTDKANPSGVISEGRCCDMGNSSKICLSGNRMEGPKVEKAKSGLVPALQQPE